MIGDGAAGAEISHTHAGTRHPEVMHTTAGVVDWKDGCVPPMIDAPCTLLVQRAFHTLRRRVAHQAASQATLGFGIDGCGRKI